MDIRALFKSQRERRLWTWVVVILITIYATLGLARTFAEFLQNRELFDGLFFVGFLFVGVAIVTQGFRTRPYRLEIAVLFGVLAVYLILFARMAIPEERSHLIEYSVVAVFIHMALIERNAHGGQVARPALAAFGITVLCGWIDEGIQATLPNRVYDITDVVFNGLAALIAISGGLAICAARRYAERKLNRSK